MNTLPLRIDFQNNERCVIAETWHTQTKGNGKHTAEEKIELSVVLTTVHASEYAISEICAEIRTFAKLASWDLRINRCNSICPGTRTRQIEWRRAHVVWNNAESARRVRVATFTEYAQSSVLGCDYRICESTKQSAITIVHAPKHVEHNTEAIVAISWWTAALPDLECVHICARAKCWVA